MKYWKQGFFETQQDGSVEISDEYWHTLLMGQSSGKQIVENESGFPILEEIVHVDDKNYEQRITEMIRQRYSMDDEFAIQRQKEMKQDEWQVYYEYCEDCKTKVKEYYK